MEILSQLEGLKRKAYTLAAVASIVLAATACGYEEEDIKYYDVQRNPDTGTITVTQFSTVETDERGFPKINGGFIVALLNNQCDISVQDKTLNLKDYGFKGDCEQLPNSNDREIYDAINDTFQNY